MNTNLNLIAKQDASSAASNDKPCSNDTASRSLVLKDIKRLAKVGFALHRLHPKSKRPIGNDWADKPVLTFERLLTTYREGENLGVRLGKWSKIGGDYLHVLDADIRDPKLAHEAHARLTELLPEWQTFPIVQSGSGGESRHVYFITDKPFASTKLAHSEEKIVGPDGKPHWAWEIELFGTGKQVVLPPSIHPDSGKPYRWLREFNFDDLDIGLGPTIRSSRVEAWLGEDGERADVDEEQQAPLGLTVAEVSDLLAVIPNDDLDYDEWLNVMASVQHEAADRSDAERKAFYEVFRAWSSQSPKHDDKTAKYKFFSFKNKATRRHRTMRSIQAEAQQIQLDAEFENLEDDDDLVSDTDETDFSHLFDDLLGDGPKPISKSQQKLNKATVEAALGHVPPKIARINLKHGVAFINGKTVILTKNADETMSYGTVGDLHNFYENDRVTTEKSTVPVTKQWMQHKKRREYPNGVVFSPGEEVAGAYNHWRGFAVEPDSKGSCELFLAHVKIIICRGNEESYQYFLGWLAHMIQKPGEKPGVAVVLRGLKGTGKDTVGDYVGGLFPHHHLKTASQELMVGRFNAHLERTLLLHVEEGLWAGNKQAEGSLKHLITSSKLTIEPKGLNAFSVKSVLRLFISSNERWVVPASEDERRYFVLDVDDRYSVTNSTPAERENYFADGILREMHNGGREALLHFLMHYDIRNFNVRDVPNTAALAEQKAQSLKNIDRWWFDLVRYGEMPVLTDHGEYADWTVGYQHIERADLRTHYKMWMQTRKYDGETLSDEDFGD